MDFDDGFAFGFGKAVGECCVGCFVLITIGALAALACVAAPYVSVLLGR
jgi:hypothetical protein